MESYNLTMRQTFLLRNMIGCPTGLTLVGKIDQDNIFGKIERISSTSYDFSYHVYTYNDKKYILPADDHAYTVYDYDAKNGEVILVNPWDTTTEVRVPKELFLKAFDLNSLVPLYIDEIRVDHLFKNALYAILNNLGDDYSDMLKYDFYLHYMGRFDE